MKQKLLTTMLAMTCLGSVSYAQTRQGSGEVLSTDGKSDSGASSVKQITAQTKIVTGRVINEVGSPLSGVTISVSGSKVAVQTNNYGEFSIKVPVGTVLTFKSLGYESADLTVGGNTSYTIKLQESKRDLDEVVVTAYGKQSKESIVGSVASVSSKDIEKRPVSSVTAVLEGAAPGLQVNNSYGEPGSSPNIRVRGFTSLNGNNSPVYILDGVVFGGNISDLSPSDIESISVLKDATSGALYGNRAAAGAIVITTKKGKGGANLKLTVNQGLFTRGIGEYETVSPSQYMEASWLGYRNSLYKPLPTSTTSTGTTYTKEQANAMANSTLVPTIMKLNIFNKPSDQLFGENGKLVEGASILGDYAGDLDWFAPITRKGYRQEYILSGNGGNEKGSYMFSGGYLDEQGYIKSSDFTRLSGRLSGEVRPTTWFKAGMSMNAGHQLSHFTNGSGSGYTNPWMFARNIAPIYPIHLHDDTTGAYTLDSEGNKQYDSGTVTRNQYAGRNMIWERELNIDDNKRNTVNSQLYADVNFLEHFKFSLVGDINLRYDETRSYENAIIGDGSGNDGRGGRETYNYKNYTLQQQLSYSNSIGGDHNFDVLVGHENYGNIYTYLYARKAGEVFPGVIELSNFNNITSLYDDTYNDKTESYLGRLRYNFQEKYFFEGSIRRDGTSRLAPDKRWGTFWSLGGSWIVSKENFIKDLDWINDLKFRAATGVVGNVTSSGLYAYQPTFTIGQNNNLPAFWKSSLGNPDLLWEGNQSSSVALDGYLFNRLNFTVEYFDKRSKDLIFDVNLPLSTGSTTSSSAVSTITKNLGTISNRGLEVTLAGDVIRNSEVRWNLGLNATFMTNKLISLPEQNRKDGIVSSPFKYVEGRSIYDYYLPVYVGVDMMTGHALYEADTELYDPTITSGAYYIYQVDINGKTYTRNSAYAKRDFLGSAIPKVFGAINTSVDYKNFSLSGIFTYSLGGKGLDYSYIDLMSLSSTPSNIHVDILNSWDGAPAGMTETSANRINPNATPEINFASSSLNNATSSRFLFDNSYFVIKNISLGYRFKQEVLQKLKMKSLNVNLSVENLATFTNGPKGYSPQQSFGGYSQNQFVPARTYSLGFNIGI